MSEDTTTIPLYTLHLDRTAQGAPIFVTFSKALADELRLTLDNLVEERYCYIHEHAPHDIRRLMTFRNLPEHVNRGFVGGVSLESVSLLYRNGRAFLTEAGQLVAQGCCLDRLPKVAFQMIAPDKIDLPEHPTFVIVPYEQTQPFPEQVKGFARLCQQISWGSWITNKREKARLEKIVDVKEFRS